MILLCGIPSEPPLAMVREALARRRVPFVQFNQRAFATWELDLGICGSSVSGRLTGDCRSWRLQDIRGVFLRLMDDRQLPEVAGLAGDAPAVRHCRGLHDTLMRWCEVTGARVVNRLAAMGSNSSKAYQMQIIAEHGFNVPDTLITSDPEAVHAFRRRHGTIVYKSISGVRSIVQRLSESDLGRLDDIRWCPTQFQAYVEGSDVRVHVVDRKVYATRIESAATDYRYAHQQVDQAARLEAIELPGEAADACVRLVRGLGLAFAGVDLRIGPDGEVTCFEVNPCPAFSYYEQQTGQPIAAAVAAYLAGGSC